MGKKAIILLVILVSILLGIGFNTSSDNRKLKAEIDKQIENIASSNLNGLEIALEKDAFRLRVHQAELSENMDDYRQKLNTSAHITYRIFKLGEVDEVLFYEGILIMEIWRPNVESDFIILGNDRRQSSRSYYGQILNDFAWKYFSEESIRQTSEKSIEPSEMSTSSRSSSSYNEDFKVDDFGEIIEPGELHFQSIHYDKNLSMTIRGYATVNNIKEPIMIVMKVDQVVGDYHPYWNLNKETINEVAFYFKDNYEGKVIISDTGIIAALIDYIKNLQFEKLEEQVMNIDECAYIMLESYEHNIILSQNAIYTNSNHAVCKGEQYVKDILEILRID